VVIGTVLDPDMQDEVKVTVVATGLNRAVARQPIRDREEAYAPARRPQVQLINTQGRRDGTTGMMVDESTPAFGHGGGIAAHLRGRTPTEPQQTPAAADFGSDSSYLDIPAFLRRQAD
jgi:cell division protein FtsZ